MILFYNKKTGKVFATVDGRVHGKKHKDCLVYDSNENKRKDVGKYIIGWEEVEDEKKFIKKEILVSIDVKEFKKLDKKNKAKSGNILYKRIKTKQRVVKRIEHNLDKFNMMQKFENKENPLNYKIKNNKLIKHNVKI